MGTPWRGHPSWQLVGQLSEVVGRDLADLLLDASPDTLRATRNSQLATYTLSLVALDAATNGPLGNSAPAGQLAAVAGHSLGEYTALVAAGALSASQGATLVQARGEAMQSAETNPGTMAAVIGLELVQVSPRLCGEVEGAWVANDNSPGQVVIAGTLQGVEGASAAALKGGAKRVIPLASRRRLPHTSHAARSGAPRRRTCSVRVCTGVLPCRRQRGRQRPHRWLPRPSFGPSFARKSAGGSSACSRFAGGTGSKPVRRTRWAAASFPGMVRRTVPEVARVPTWRRPGGDLEALASTISS